MKKYEGSLISLKLKGRRIRMEGLVIDYNKDWTLLRYNPVDYVIDGYALINNKKIKDFQRGKEELFKDKIIKLKKLPPAHADSYPAFGLENIIDVLASQNSLIQVETSSESVTFVGFVSLINRGPIVLNSIKPNGKNSGKMIIPINEIRTIQYENDYLTSLKLYIDKMKEQKKAL